MLKMMSWSWWQPVSQPYCLGSKLSSSAKSKSEPEEFWGCSYHRHWGSSLLLYFALHHEKWAFCCTVDKQSGRSSPGSSFKLASHLSIQTLWSGSVHSFYCLWIQVKSFRWYSHQSSEWGGLSDFDYGMVFSARFAGLRITQQSHGFTRYCAKNNKK